MPYNLGKRLKLKEQEAKTAHDKIISFCVNAKSPREKLYIVTTIFDKTQHELNIFVGGILILSLLQTPLIP